MRTKSGEVLADVINSSGKIVGKGRVVEGGKLRQLAGGAFQILSIAVAQSHLEDIEQTLKSIEDGIEKILNSMSIEDEAKIRGSFNYIREIAENMLHGRYPGGLPQHKKNVIEGVVRDSYTYLLKLEGEVKSLTKRIRSLEDGDMFGTGNTYNQLIKSIEEIKPLLDRRDCFLDLVLVIGYVTTYSNLMQDGQYGSEFTRIDENCKNWSELIDNFKRVVDGAKKKFISKAVFNFDETLAQRREKIDSLSSEYLTCSEEKQKYYLSQKSKIEETMKNLIDSDGGLHIAISFDEQGGVKEAAIL